MASWSDECDGVRADRAAARALRVDDRRGSSRRPEPPRRPGAPVHARRRRRAHGRGPPRLPRPADRRTRPAAQPRRRPPAEHDHYRYLLIDEFQDTDPIQVELAILLATGASEVGADDAWHELPVDPGRVFFVGDPKQSIYRFRRADIDLFLDVQSKAADEVLHLSANFRSVPGVVEWVNAVFGELMPAEQKRGQAAYQPLTASRPPMDGGRARGHHHRPASTTPRSARCARSRPPRSPPSSARPGDRWPVHVDDPPDGAASTRPAQWQDMAILLPTRTSLPMLEKALGAADVPYRVESASLVWSTQRGARAPGDPAGDRRPVRRGGRGGGAALAVVRAAATTTSSPTGWPADAGRRRAACPRASTSSTPWCAGSPSCGRSTTSVGGPVSSGLVEQVLRRFRFFELATAGPRPRDPWRRLRFVLQQAREFEATPGATLRRFLDWADAQASEAARVREPVLPESDDDAVRILTVHGAKGLEFPIVVLSGLNRGRDNRYSTVLWDDDQTAQVKISRFESTGFGDVSELSKELDKEERLRLLYVAATRARDHLVLSLHTPERGDNDAKLLAGTAESSWGRPGRAGSVGGHRSVGRSHPAPMSRSPSRCRCHRPWSPPTSWALVPPGSPTANACSRPAGGSSAGRPRRCRPPTTRSPSPTTSPIGTASDGPAARWVERCTPRSSPSTWRRAPTSPPSRRPKRPPSASPSWRPEVEKGRAQRARAPTCRRGGAPPALARDVRRRPHATGMVEGFIDLLYETPEGLVIVDYKTDRAPEPDGMAAAVARYRLQLATYALALEQTLGRPVAGAALLFVSGSEARTRWIDDLPGAVREVSDLLSSPS